MNRVPHPVPIYYWTWERWKRGHAEFKKYGPAYPPARPKAPVWPSGKVPLWARELYARRMAAVALANKPTPVVKPPQNIFAGRGQFTAHDPMSALQLVGHIDWIALKADGTDKCSPEAARLLRPLFKYIFVWESEPTEGLDAVVRYWANGYIGQAEGRGQFDAALRLEAGLAKVPLALISNVTWLEERWPEKWGCIGEAYWNVNPNARPIDLEYEAVKPQRRAKFFSPCFGQYESDTEGAVKKPIWEYLANWPGNNWCGYLMENLTPEEVSYIKSLPRNR